MARLSLRATRKIRGSFRNDRMPGAVESAFRPRVGLYMISDTTSGNIRMTRAKELE